MKIILFAKTNCQPCESVTAWLNDQAITYDKIDAYDNPEAAAKYMVRVLPTIVLVDNAGEVVEHTTGFKVGNLENIRNKALAQA